MIRKLSFKHYLLLLLAVFSMGAANAQSTTINTNYTSAPGPGVVPFPMSSPNSFITFRVTNNNPYAIQVTDVSHLHVASADITQGTTVLVQGYSMNNAKYSLWYTTTNVTGNPNIGITTGWTKAGDYGPVSTTGNIVTTVMSNAEGFVAPGATARFALAVTDTIAATGPSPSPTSFTAAGVTLDVSGAYWGVMPNSGASMNFALNGSITFKPGIPRPDVTVNPSTICIGTNTMLVAKAAPYIAAPQFRWYRNGTLVSSNDTFIINNTQLSDAGAYKVIVIDTTRISDSATAFVDVKNPKAPTYTGKTQYCLNEPFEAINIIGSNPKWYYVQSGGSPLPLTPTFNTTTPNNFTYYISQTVNGCESFERTRVYFSAAPKPPVPSATTPIYYCENNQADPLVANGENLSWYYDETGGVPSSIAPTPNTTVKGTEDYYVTQTVDGCASDRKKIDVITTFRPNGLILPSDRDICAGDSISIGYYGSAFPGSAYNWSLPTGSSNITGIDQGPLRLNLDTPGLHKVTLQVGNVGCYSKQYEESILVRPIPTATILAKNELCLGQSDLITLDSYTQTIDTFTWDWAGGQTTHFSTDQGPFGVFWSTPGEKVISVTVSEKECKATITDTVNVHPKPDATITAFTRTVGDRNSNYNTTFTENYTAGNQVCFGDSLKLEPTTINASSKYIWTPTRFFGENSSSAAAFARIDYKGYIKLRVEDQIGCFNEDSIMVDTKSCCDMEFPTAFSPNNDGRNDVFRPISLANYDVKTFRVLNRYGQTIFEGRDIYKGWDGTLNGEPQDLNTYFYFISFKCNGEYVEKKGEVILVR